MLVSFSSSSENEKPNPSLSDVAEESPDVSGEGVTDISGFGSAVSFVLSVALSVVLSDVLSDVLAAVLSVVISDVFSEELPSVLMPVVPVGTPELPLPPAYFKAKITVPAITIHIPEASSPVTMFSLRFLLLRTVNPL